MIDESLSLNLPEATLFETGNNQWRNFDTYPPKNAQETTLYFQNGGKLGLTKPQNENGLTSYVSDPNRPVPFSGKINDGFSAEYMVEDQRFAYQRPDVISFETDTLKDDLTMVGNILANLKVSTTGTDADFFVKLIDIYPADEKGMKEKPGVIYGNYHQMVRSEIMPARFRNSFEKPEALVPNQETEVVFNLQDVLHTFKKGHKIQIQVQSTAYPLFAVNPQKFLENPYKAEKSDYTKAFQKIFNNSVIEVEILK